MGSPRSALGCEVRTRCTCDVFCLCLFLFDLYNSGGTMDYHGLWVWVRWRKVKTLFPRGCRGVEGAGRTAHTVRAARGWGIVCAVWTQYICDICTYSITALFLFNNFKMLGWGEVSICIYNYSGFISRVLCLASLWFWGVVWVWESLRRGDAPAPPAAHHTQQNKGQ